MRYFKWQSKDQLFLVEKFVGTFTPEFVELSDKYLLDYNKNLLELNLISDVSEAFFHSLNPLEAISIANKFLKSVPDKLQVKFMLVVGTEKRKDQSLIQLYAKQIEQDERVYFKTFNEMSSSFNWIKLDHETTTEINEEIKQWNNQEL
ncbi:hypothetical protein [Ekhidna sp.]|uniref:hypothetical protein n=1 Tax=Ekhidna sp. TaxID=2608089 RepID=UPI003CCC1E21